MSIHIPSGNGYLKTVKMFTLVRFLILFCVVAVFVYGCSFIRYENSACDSISREEVFKTIQGIFPEMKIVDIVPMSFGGIYGVFYLESEKSDPSFSEVRAFYYHPCKKIFMFGEFIASNGTFLTGEQIRTYENQILNKEKR